jgi:hypothetical protein
MLKTVVILPPQWVKKCLEGGPNTAQFLKEIGVAQITFKKRNRDLGGHYNDGVSFRLVPIFINFRKAEIGAALATS